MSVQAIKARRVLKVLLHSFLICTPSGSDWPASRFDLFSPWE